MPAGAPQAELVFLPYYFFELSDATASEEQSAASEEITRSIAEVNSITSSTSEAMREATKGLESLRRRSQDLIRLIDEMKNA